MKTLGVQVITPADDELIPEGFLQSQMGASLGRGIVEEGLVRFEKELCKGCEDMDFEHYHWWGTVDVGAPNG